jgi:hypothetical protein
VKRNPSWQCNSVATFVPIQFQINPTIVLPSHFVEESFRELLKDKSHTNNYGTEEYLKKKKEGARFQELNI